ncbi:MAG: RNA methyltransferase [Deltaproteobacteria bacterium]|nr:RNA methyltransferase [Deltaproteobacteria bacterium]
MKPAPEPFETLYGLRACLAVGAVRPEAIARLALQPGLRGSTPELAELVRRVSARGVPWDERPEAELTRLAASPTHEGVCMQVKPRRWVKLPELEATLLRERGVALALSQVRNPYNVGAVLRSAAFFGAKAVLLGAPAPDPGLPPLAVRVAEGGAEHLHLARTTDLVPWLQRLRTRGVSVLGAVGSAPTSAHTWVFKRPCVVVLGNEREGLSERVLAGCDGVLSIAGGGALESLNVAVAAGVLLSLALRGDA